MSLLKGGIIKINQVEIHLILTGENNITIDRIYVAPDLRLKGLAKTALKQLAQIADEQKVTLSACIAPDEKNYKLIDSLRHILTELDFKPLRLDGEIYYNDLTRAPL